MLKEHTSEFTQLKLVLDLVLVTCGFFVGLLVYTWMFDGHYQDNYIGLLVMLMLIWVGLMHYFGIYDSMRVKKIPEILFIIFKTTIIGFIIYGSAIYLFKITGISRFLICSTFIFTSIFIGLEKILLVLFTRNVRLKGLNFRRVLIVGTGKRALRFIDVITDHPEWGLKVLGIVDKDPKKVGEKINGSSVIGSFDDIPDIVHNNVVDEVLFVVPRSWLSQIEKIMHFLELEGIRVNVAVDYFELKLSRAEQTHLNGFPMITFKTTPDKLWHLLSKRLFDITVSLLGIIFLWPIFVIVAIMTKVTSKGPIFFRQKRCGLNGRRFNLYKFRTMVVDAEERLRDLLHNNEVAGPAFKMKDDPRLTKTGKFLRKFSIDEFPQLWNVLKGDMSLVGPRPPIPKEVENYDNWQRRRLSMRPGITCLWQVNGRSEISDFDEWVKLDLEYIDKWSIWLDFKILFKTIPVVLFGIGAR